MPSLFNDCQATKEVDVDSVLLSKVQSFVSSQLRPLADEFERTTTFPSSLLPAIRKLGLFGLNIPKNYGGLEASRKTISLITEELSSGWISVASLVGSHLKVSSHITTFGTDKQKEKYLPKMATGEIIAAHANMEKNNKAKDQTQTTIRYQDGKFTIFGQKDWVLSSRDADMFAVSAKLVGSHPTVKEDTILVALVDKSLEGVATGDDDTPRMGVNGVNLSPVVLNNCVIDTEAIIGEFKHDGKDIIESAKKAAYIAYSSRAIGASRDLLDRCKSFVQNKERTLVNEALENEPGVRNKLTYLDIKLAAAKSFLMKTIEDLAHDPTDQISPIQCKIFCTETAKSISLGVFKIFSAAGYTRENGIERIVRDIAALGIIGAPNYELLERIASKTLATKTPSNEENITLKYAKLCAPQIPYKYFEQATLGETMRIIGSENIKGINVSYLDMTTGNPSGTFKDTLACLTLAYCLHNKIKAFCFSSSGNTGVSFAKYANHVGVKAILFYPKSSTYKLDNPSFGKNVTAVEVDGTELEVKDILGRFSKISGLPILPTLHNQIDGNKFRAHFLYEHYLNTGIQYEWHAQSVSSAMGPFGFYDGVADIQKTDSSFKAPKFLAIQQEAICPYVHRFGKFPEGYAPSTEIVEPTLFRSQPTPDLYERMEYILKTHGGQVDCLLNRELFQYQSFAIQKLLRKGIDTNWVTTEKGPTMIESAGIICLSDVLKNIDQGKFSHGSSVLVGITGGMRKTPPLSFKADFGITGTASDEILSDLSKSFLEKL